MPDGNGDAQLVPKPKKWHVGAQPQPLPAFGGGLCNILRRTCPRGTREVIGPFEPATATGWRFRSSLSESVKPINCTKPIIYCASYLYHFTDIVFYALSVTMKTRTFLQGNFPFCTGVFAVTWAWKRFFPLIGNQYTNGPELYQPWAYPIVLLAPHDPVSPRHLLRLSPDFKSLIPMSDLHITGFGAPLPVQLYSGYTQLPHALFKSPASRV